MVENKQKETKKTPMKLAIKKHRKQQKHATLSSFTLCHSLLTRHALDQHLTSLLMTSSMMDHPSSSMSINRLYFSLYDENNGDHDDLEAKEMLSSFHQLFQNEQKLKKHEKENSYEQLLDHCANFWKNEVQIDDVELSDDEKFEAMMRKKSFNSPKRMKKCREMILEAKMHIFSRWQHEKLLNLNVIRSYLRQLRREKRKLAHLLLLFLFFFRFQSFCT